MYFFVRILYFYKLSLNYFLYLYYLETDNCIYLNISFEISLNCHCTMTNFLLFQYTA